MVPARFVPKFASRLLAWHVATTGDPLMAAPFAPWFRALICAELALQLPFFFAASYAFATRGNWIRIPALAYGVHTATSLIPILAEIATSPKVPSEAARVQLLALYLPYLVLPLVCAVWMAASPKPFAARARVAPKSRARKAD